MSVTTISSQVSTARPRNTYLDLLRGLAVFFVILGHCMANYTHSYYHSGDFWSDKWHILIYTFHMPLFALISGYFFQRSITKLSFSRLLREKLPNFLLPWIVWGTLSWLVGGILSGDLTLSLASLKDLVHHVLMTYWFIPTIAGVMLLYFHWYRYQRAKGWTMGLLIAILMLLPLSLPFGLYDIAKIKFITFLLPFFAVGAYISGNQHSVIEVYKRFRLGILLVSAISFTLLYISYSPEDYIYESGVSLLNSPHGFVGQLTINLKRWAIGFVGSLLIAVLAYHLVYLARIMSGLSKILVMLGTVSLEVYLIQEIIIGYFIRHYSLGASFPNMYIAALVLSLVTTAIVLIVLKTFPYPKWLSRILWGR